MKIAFNNALLRAERGAADGNAPECQPLDSSARALLTVLPKLGALSATGKELVAAIQPAVTTFQAAASACVAKDFATARASLASGVAQQADAQARVDEILDGDA